MRGGTLSGVRRVLSRRSVQAVVIVVGVALVGAFVVARLPRSISAVGTLDQCLWGWPVVVFEGEDWKAALPDNLRAYAPRQIPVAEWPVGLRFDETAGVLLDGQGDAVFRNGARVRVAGTVVETQGDPAPCFYTLGVKVETITAP